MVGVQAKVCMDSVAIAKAEIVGKQCTVALSQMDRVLVVAEHNGIGQSRRENRNHIVDFELA